MINFNKFHLFLKKIDNKLFFLIISLLLFLVILIGFNYYRNKIRVLEMKLSNEINLKNALIDNIKIYQNKEKNWVAEKLTIQENINNLKKINSNLTNNQKKLLSKIEEVNRKNKIITAALIEAKIQIDSLLHTGNTIIDTSNKKITFSDHYKKDNKEVVYKISVKNVLPYPINIKPTLIFDSLYFPNTQFIEFHWKNNRKEGYPISFSITNSNNFFKVVNIDSYAIPELKKEEIKPSGWNKFTNFLIQKGNVGIYITVGGIIGATTVLLINK